MCFRLCLMTLCVVDVEFSRFACRAPVVCGKRYERFYRGRSRGTWRLV
jgi:hypothetical protein